MTDQNSPWIDVSIALPVISPLTEEEFNPQWGRFKGICPSSKMVFFRLKKYGQIKTGWLLESGSGLLFECQQGYALYPYRDVDIWMQVPAFPELPSKQPPQKCCSYCDGQFYCSYCSDDSQYGD